MADENKLAKKIRQEFTHVGFVYDVTDICQAIDEGRKPVEAIKSLYPSVPKASLPHLVRKLKKHPYYIAKQDLETAILKEAGPKLQMNLLDLAFNARSEMVKFSATDSALDRVYGKEDETSQGEAPALVFNFNLGGGQTVTKKVEDGTIIDQ